MAGHSKWANIRRRKEAQDAKKARAYTKVTKEIILATQEGGSRPEENARLRLAIQNAKAVNLPKDNILRAIQKGSGAGATSYHYQEYEGYAPHGVAVLVSCTTDNLNRTIAMVRSLFKKYGGSLGKQGSIKHLFDHKGSFVVDPATITDYEARYLEWIEAGVSDIEEGEEYRLICDFKDFGAVQKTLEAQGIMPKESEIAYLPHTTTTLPPEAQAKVEKFIEALEGEDDVQQVYHNMT